MFEFSCVLGPRLNISSGLPGSWWNISQERKNVSLKEAHNRCILCIDYNQIVKFPFLIFFSSLTVPECLKRDSDSHSWVKIWISVQVKYFSKTVIVSEFLTLNVVLSCVYVTDVLWKSYNVLTWFILQVKMDQRWCRVYFIVTITDFFCQYRFLLTRVGLVRDNIVLSMWIFTCLIELRKVSSATTYINVTASILTASLDLVRAIILRGLFQSFWALGYLSPCHRKEQKVRKQQSDISQVVMVES